MTGYTLDTNVVSETAKNAPNPRLIAFLNRETDLWLPSVVVHELEYGLELLPQGRRRDSLRAAIDHILQTYRDRILPLERVGAEWAARYRAQVRSAGREPNMGDC